MNRFARGLSNAIRLLVAITCLGSEALAETTQPTLAVLVYNNANVPEPIVAEAGSEVRRIFKDIGVGIIWDVNPQVHAGEPQLPVTTSARKGAAQVIISIIPKPIDDFPLLVRRSRYIMGFTPTGEGVLSYVFYDRIQDFLSGNGDFYRAQHWPAPRVLGYIVAHELGHLLIRGAAHSKEGIMKGVPGWNEIVRPGRFTREEAKKIRSDIERRATREIFRPE
jgi:hypothetical protein